MSEETTYEYDNLGRLWKVIDAKNQTTEYSYDDQSRIETIAYADGKTVTLSYDADGNLAGYSDGTTSATYTYDDMGRKLTETVNYGSFSKSFSYTYYGNGLKHTFMAPDGTVYTCTGACPEPVEGASPMNCKNYKNHPLGFSIRWKIFIQYTFPQLSIDFANLCAHATSFSSCKNDAVNCNPRGKPR